MDLCYLRTCNSSALGIFIFSLQCFQFHDDMPLLYEELIDSPFVTISNANEHALELFTVSSVSSFPFQPFASPCCILDMFFPFLFFFLFFFNFSPDDIFIDFRESGRKREKH